MTREERLKRLGARLRVHKGENGLTIITCVGPRGASMVALPVSMHEAANKAIDGYEAFEKITIEEILGEKKKG